MINTAWRSIEQVLELAALRDDKLFYFYDDLDEESRGYRAAYEDQIGVTEEVYCRLTFYNCRIRSVCLSASQCPPQCPSLLHVFGHYVLLLSFITRATLC